MRNRHMKKELFMNRLAWFVWIGLLAAAGCRKPAENGGVRGRAAVPVRLVAVSRQRLSEPVRTSGFLSSEAQMKLSFKTGGIVDRIAVEEGELVRRGRLLASLKLDEIRAMAEQAKNGYEKAKRDFERAQNLYRDSVATLEQVQDAETGLNVAKSNLEIAEFNLAHSSISAPCDGRILKSLAEENELIGPGYPAFLFGTDGSGWIVKVGVVDRDAVRLAKNDSASVLFDAFPGERCAAAVRTVSGAPDPLSGVFEVELSVRSGAHRFVNGLMADAEIFPSRKRDMWVVPIEALAEADGNRGVAYTVGADSTARRLPVAIGFLSGRSAAVVSGLETVHAVVAEGASYLTDGAPVRVIEASK
jgi:RND family efflux transporter MFP subunit